MIRTVRMEINLSPEEAALVHEVHQLTADTLRRTTWLRLLLLSTIQQLKEQAS